MERKQKNKIKKIIITILLIVISITMIVIYTIKTNGQLNTTEKFIEYDGDIMAIPYGRSDIDVYADGKIWAKSVEYGKAKKEIASEEIEKLKEKLKEIDYMNLKEQYNVYGTGNYEEIAINLEGNKKKIRLDYIMSRQDSTNLPKELNEFMRLFKETIYEKVEE